MALYSHSGVKLFISSELRFIDAEYMAYMACVVVVSVYGGSLLVLLWSLFFDFY